MPVKLIALDVDGTLLDSTAQLPENNRRVLHEAAVHGIEIVLATGRSFHHTRELATQMPAQTVLILNNGSLVKDRTGLTLASHGLPAATRVSTDASDRSHAGRADSSAPHRG